MRGNDEVRVIESRNQEVASFELSNLTLSIFTRNFLRRRSFFVTASTGITTRSCNECLYNYTTVSGTITLARGKPYPM